MDTDGELLRRYAEEHSETAFAGLVERHVGLVFHAALRRTNQNAALAEDVTQLVFAAVAREADKLRNHTALTGWLYVATGHAAAKAMRGEARRRKYTQEFSAMQSTEQRDVAGGAEWEQLKPVLDDMMDELGDADREAVLMRFFEGRAFGEVGAALRVSEDAARVRVNRALEKLRGLLAKRGVTSTAAALGGLLAGNAAVAAPAGMAASVTGAALAGSTAVAASVGAASAAGVSGLGTGILSFMTTTKWVTGVACVVAAVSVGTAVYERNGRQAAQEEIARLTSDAQRLSLRINELERAQKETEMRVKADVDAREAGQKRQAEAKATQSIQNAVSQQDAAYADPRYVELMSRWSRTNLPFVYGPLYRKLNYSKEQIARFEKAMMEMVEADIDVKAAARTQGVSLNDKALWQLEADAKKRSEENLRAVMGDEGYAAYKNFRKDGVVREPLNAFLVEALYQGAPFSADQVERLVQVSLKNKIETKTPTPGGSSTHTTYDWDAVQSEMTDLTAEQKSLLKAYAEKRKADSEQSALSRELRNRPASP